MDSTKFHPVQTSSSSAQVVEQIRRLIEKGELAPGARLPSERDLALRFGVSRPTIREALRGLVTLRLLEARQGSGTFVSAHVTTDDDPAHWLPWLTAHHEDVLALLEVREALETKSAALAAVALAARNPGTQKTLKALTTNVEAMAAAAEQHDLAGLERRDLEFHSLLAELTHNRYLLNLSRSINHVFADRRAVMAIPGWAQHSVEQHRIILAAVRAGDTAGATAAMAIHMESTKARVRDLT